MHHTLTPAYGRDYKSKPAVLSDWLAGKDFMLEEPWRAVPINEPDADKSASYNVRYGKLERVAVLRYNKGAWHIL
jgi:hypothetical protein